MGMGIPSFEASKQAPNDELMSSVCNRSDAQGPQSAMGKRIDRLTGCWAYLCGAAHGCVVLCGRARVPCEGYAPAACVRLNDASGRFEAFDESTQFDRARPNQHPGIDPKGHPPHTPNRLQVDGDGGQRAQTTRCEAEQGTGNGCINFPTNCPATAVDASTIVASRPGLLQAQKAVLPPIHTPIDLKRLSTMRITHH